ncbi:hypothetical protein BH11PLA1_BH11PLA1_14140 [soil metagenome]
MKLHPRPARAVSTSLCTLAVLHAATLAFAGPLTPPVGIVTPTNKTLAEVEPRIAINATNTPGDASAVYRITQPGSYYLTGNLSGAAGKYVIYCTAPYVTIDLNGFVIAGGSGSLSGIRVFDACTIRNGTIRACGGAGIDAGTRAHIVAITATTNTGVGIDIGGNNGLVEGCVCAGNTGGGITTIGSANGTIVNCTFSENGGNGVYLSSSWRIASSTIGGNDAIGIDAQQNGLIENCLISFNGTHGVRAGSRCRITNNSIVDNGQTIVSGAGILCTGGYAHADANTVSGNDIGIQVTGTNRNFIARNMCGNNPLTNFSIVAGNICFVVAAVPVAAGFSGDSGGVSPGSTNPHANYGY